MENLDLIKELTEAHGVAGFESDVRKIIEKRLLGKAEISQDNLGGIICCKKGSDEYPKIMVNAHMDEIGFMVSSIKNGFIKFVAIGGWWDQTLLAKRVTIKTRNGYIKGVIGTKPVHILPSADRTKVFEKNQMFIDVGASSNEEVEAMGICLGDPIVPDSNLEILNDKIIMAKALDCRLGVGTVVNLIEKLQTVEHPNTVFGVGTVQEEVGLRGAVTSANTVMPDISVTIEGGFTTDTPGSENEDIRWGLGRGPGIDLYDNGMIANPSLLSLVLDTAEENNIPVQCGIALGARTDSSEIQKFGRGVPSITICVPSRYIHTHNGVFNYDDYEMTVNLIQALVRKLDTSTVNQIKQGEYRRKYGR